jgi:hypothetical protein
MGVRRTTSLDCSDWPKAGHCFLDDITEIDPATQSKLLRAIQERAIRPLDSVQEQPINVRTIGVNQSRPAGGDCRRPSASGSLHRSQASMLHVQALCEPRSFWRSCSSRKRRSTGPMRKEEAEKNGELAQTEFGFASRGHQPYSKEGTDQ